MSGTDNPVLRDLLHDILATCDQTTADLANGDAIAVSGIQRVLSELEQTARH